MEKQTDDALDIRLFGVQEFNLAFKHPVNNNPTLQTVELVKNKIKYIQEELDELLKATEEGNIVDVLDALVDIDYFNLGVVCAFGLQNRYQAAFDLVQKANMSKLCSSLEEVAATQAKLAEQDIETTYAEVLPDKWAVYNKANNKVMKSISFVAPDLSVLF